ncbi:hypothetical protein KIW84_053870 [Lathyrus oleraceus]|uniref:Retrovirus-related Pol polyprotein from transposon TNT 1-94 n=1 Tax=Pisum sativum TaxID=3888 RepID=A0A9D5AHD6_PEA|nr:hypothetical protein KIW84_053870 [Pisum sativum]
MYVEKVLRRFSMDKAKAESILLASHFKLSHKLCPFTDEEKLSMKNIPYSSVVGSLMYVMVCTRPDIAHVVGMLTLGCKKPMLVGYTNLDLAGSLDDQKSTSGRTGVALKLVGRGSLLGYPSYWE